MDYIEHEVINFKTKSRITGKVTLKKLLELCSKKGYLIKYYSEATAFLICLGLYEESQTAASVSAVSNSGSAFIFLRDNMSPEKEMFAIAHELGHIELNHTKPSDPKAEDEANQFAHLLLAKRFIRSRRAVSLMLPLTVFCFGLYILLGYYSSAPDNNDAATSSSQKIISAQTQSIVSQSEDNDIVCYFTRTGTVYHLYEDCQYIRNSTEVICSTINSCYKDHLCLICERRKNKE